MRDSIQLVRGAVSTKDLVPVLTHFALSQGWLHGYNGRVHLCAPVADLKHLALTVPAIPFLQAIDGVGPGIEPTLTLLPAPTALGEAPTPLPALGSGGEPDHRPERPLGGSESRPGAKVEGLLPPLGKLAIEAPPFRAILPVGPIEAFPGIDPPPPQDRQAWREGLLAPLTRLHPFIGEDASRPWACGLWACGRLLAATNNVVVALMPLPGRQRWPHLPGTILPKYAIDELMRIGQEPESLLVDANQFVAWLPSKAWLRTSLVEGAWPTSPVDLIQQLHQGAIFKAIPTTLKAAVEQIRPFCIDAKNPMVILEGDRICTQQGDMSAEVRGFDFPNKCAFRIEPLLMVLTEATHADWTKFPRVPWIGEKIKGAIVGVVT